MLVLGRRHLERVLRTYTAHYNDARSHRRSRPEDARTSARSDSSSRRWRAGSEGTISSAASSMSTSRPLEPNRRFVCPSGSPADRRHRRTAASTELKERRERRCTLERRK
ncbi:MAG TPA: hypothetical protein VFA00_09635 [Actinomycetota bacterium]|nr:hypothetical protein [Actinomycetota bacterium]